MDCIYHSCQGESHKATGKPCQDASYSGCSDGIAMAIVSDGHGGERYFRSQIGSKLAVDITKKAITEFVKTISSEQEGIIINEPYTDFIADKALNEQLDSKSHKALMWLFSSIISQWNQAIAQDAVNNDLTEWELEHVDKKYIDEFIEKKKDDCATFEKTYGCTLMAYVQTPEFWLAFHIGDGKFVTMNLSCGDLKCEQPIPWDERCFLNKTTSMCDSHALEAFRYCYQGDGGFPFAVFLGSDGLDDSYGDGDQLYNFYIEVYKQIEKSGREDAFCVLRDSLPKISKVGSKDDMSVACVYDESQLDNMFPVLVQYQQDKLNYQIDKLKREHAILLKKIEAEDKKADLTQSESINLSYDYKKLDKINADLRKKTSKFSSLREELRKFENRQSKGCKRSNISKSSTTLKDIRNR